MGRLAGLEPATQGLGIPCSIRTELQAHDSFKNITERLLYFNSSSNFLKGVLILDEDTKLD
jgi:hypothetical protein